MALPCLLASAGLALGLASLAAPGGAPRLFTAPHERPWRRVDGPPAELSAGRASFRDTARPGAFHVFQLGLVAGEDTGPLGLEFGPLTAGSVPPIPASAFRCLSLAGVGPDGRPFTKSLSVPAGATQVLWCGLDVPPGARGLYRARATLRAGGTVLGHYDLAFTVGGEPVAHHGEDAAASLARLRWLDSTVGSEPALTRPFTPVAVGGRHIRILGRELQVGADGLPAQVLSYFSAANTAIGQTASPLLAAPMAFVVETPQGPLTWRTRAGDVQHSSLEATWQAELRAAGIRADVTGRLDYTGAGRLAIRLRSDAATAVSDIRLEVPWAREAATYFMGLGRPGGKRPDEPLRWTWDAARHQDCFWMGAVNRGMLLRLKDDRYRRPLVNIYYSFRPLLMPRTWDNGGQGGIVVSPASGEAVNVRCFSGPRTLHPGETLAFDVDFYLTPFHPLGTRQQWDVRFLHPGASHDPALIEQAVEQLSPEAGPNVLNIHQANAVAPFINYPYADSNLPALRAIIQRAHERGCRARVYYTTRELTQNLPELHALHALNGEIIFPGPGPASRTLINSGGPHPWLTANLGADFLPAWVDHIQRPEAEWDLSVITQPDSRWNNFYLEGLRWMVDNLGLDGVYIDDTALDARSLQRARRILDRRPGRLMDLHTWNHMNEWAGYANCLNIYMEILPYLDRLWLGEGFPANAVTWDFWLVEMSGLPFGLMSEMLDGADPSRGLVFGETPRMGWSGDPRPLWEVMDRYGVRGSEFIPFVVPDSPVQTGRPDVLATVYRNQGRTVVALGNWSGRSCSVPLQVDGPALGLDLSRATLYAPAVAGVQAEALYRPGEAIPLPAGRGLILVLDETARQVTRLQDVEASLTDAFRDAFSAPALSPGWRLHRTAADPMAVEQRAGMLRMEGPANRVGGAERDLPPSVRAVEVALDAGTDQGKTWGCGVALVWPGGAAARLNLRVPEDRYGTLGPDGIRLLGGPLDLSQRQRLRLLLTTDAVLFQVGAGDEWSTVDAQSRAGCEGDPCLVRVGKLGGAADWQDHAGEAGDPGWCAIREVRVRCGP
jgi:hypothetical protein